MGWVLRACADSTYYIEIYGMYETLISLRIHHGGVFTKKPGRQYVNGNTQYVDLVDTDVFSVHELNAMVAETGYNDPVPMYYHFLVPDSELDYGLMPLGNDQDVLEFFKYFPRLKIVVVYIEHWRTNLKTYFRSPKSGKVIIEEIPDDQSAELRKCKKKCKKKLYLEWINEDTGLGINEDTGLGSNVGTSQKGDQPSFEGNNGLGSNVGTNQKGDQPSFEDNNGLGSNVGTSQKGDQPSFEDNNGLGSNVDTNQNVGDNNGMDIHVDESYVVGEPEFVVENIDDLNIDDLNIDDLNIDVNCLDMDDFNPFEDDRQDMDYEDELDGLDDNNDEHGLDDDTNDEPGLDDHTNDDIEVDMTGFTNNVDMELEEDKVVFENQIRDDDQCLAADLEAFDSPIRDDDPEAERKKGLKQLREKTPKDGSEGNCGFYIAQVFGTKKGIKKAIQYYAIQSRRQIKIVKNDQSRVRAKCMGKIQSLHKDKGESSKGKSVGASGEECPWVLLISKGKDDHTWTVKTYRGEHKCIHSREIKACTATFLSQQITDQLVHNPEVPLQALKQSLEQKYSVKVSHMKSFRAKKMALKQLRGDYVGQYSLLRDYLCELQRTNPDTTVKLEVETEPNAASMTRQFKRIYICLGALKKGFKAGLRDLLGLDGTFMKGPFPGQLLTAVGLDGNNGIYPVAYAIVEAETTSSWSWFLEYLRDDLDLAPNSNFTFISDRQKGILPAIERVFPSAEHRYCVRHISENMKLQWKGKVFKDQLWKCATATTIPLFEHAMEEMRLLRTEVYQWLRQIPPQHWTRSHFTGRCHTDVLLNNLCKVFNKQLVEGRDKPIITALEYIRQYLMKRMAKVQRLITAANGSLTPTATKILEEVKQEATKYSVIRNGGDMYEVSGPNMDQCIVDYHHKHCSCRRWELTGIPCKHVVAVIWDMENNGLAAEEPESLVHDSYLMETWKKVYNFKLEPINGRLMWPKSQCPTTLTPPKHHTQVGRPRKKRKKTVEEISQASNKLPRSGMRGKCTKCKQVGHNARTCKEQASGSQA